MKTFNTILNAIVWILCLLSSGVIWQQRLIITKFTNLTIKSMNNTNQAINIINQCRTNTQTLLTEYQQSNQFQMALSRINPKIYNRQTNNCFDYSLALQQELRNMGIESSIFINENRNHAWLAVWIEATNGRFIDPKKNNLHPIEVRADQNTVLLADPIKSKVPVSTSSFPRL